MMLEKPIDSRWTDAQWQAITTEGHNLLVAAAAGSGKTAVLVERIIRKITDPDRRTGIDNLLVVTFTKAAASEMRDRIGRAIDQKLSENPGDLYLRRQQALLGKASIMTLHAFCSSVIRNFYYYLDLDPGFRLVDEVEAVLIREEVLDDVMEAYYASDNSAFFRLVDRYSGDRSDDALRELIFRLYDFSMSHPWPEHWLDHMVSVYQQDETGAIDALDWIAELKKILAVRLAGASSELDAALAICSEPQGPAVYTETLMNDLGHFAQLPDVTAAPWATIRAAILAFDFGKLQTCRDKSVDEALKKRVQKSRDHVKKIIAELQTDWFQRSAEEGLQDLKEMADSVAVLRAITSDFSKAFKNEKRKKNLLDFSDLEHECLAILRSPESVPGKEFPSDAARHYQAKFSEVLIDEYQDTNRVQEAIIQLITRDEKDGGNLFMVGDVKQSIYGFRLAEPGLFLSKYKNYSAPGNPGEKIDLSSNFRSRAEVIHGINYIFRQNMDEPVGGVAYDASAELKCGADYPDYPSAVELEIIDHDPDSDTGDSEDNRESIEIEASAIADRIAALIGDGTQGAYKIYDRKSGQMRAIKYRDIAILMRAANRSAAIIKETLQTRNIPSYAELSKGYFDTIEVTVMLAVLQVIDNPYQDIPLASVLRSPIFRFSGEDLAAIRVRDQQSGYFDALKQYGAAQKDELSERIAHFLEQLEEWRNLSKRIPVSQLIWQIYRDSGYFDYVGGLIGGAQRQANLKALYDRAGQYEQTSFRGLFRFLRFIGRMRETGGDMGEARALSEQADVVRIMTIHKSKGLEFPVVFVAGLGKRFNMSDTTAPALLHKSIGFGTRWIDPEQRISVPTLLYLAIKEQLRAESLAEEMRVLYVALTRAKEKLILCGSVTGAERSMKPWQSVMHAHGWLLPEHLRRSAVSFLDWIVPSLIRHQSAGVLHEIAGDQPDKTAVSLDPSDWLISCVPAGSIEPAHSESVQKDAERLEHLKDWKAVASFSGLQDEVARRLNWSYPSAPSTLSMAKQTVTEIKAQQDYFSEGQDDRPLDHQSLIIGGDRPRFLQKEGLSAAERGTAVHLLMQHLSLEGSMRAEDIHRQGLGLVQKEILTAEQEAQMDYLAIDRFFQSPIGQKMLAARKLFRECPFSLAADASMIYRSWPQTNRQEKEKVLIQGVIDCMIEDADGLILIDYKTDHLSHLFPEKEAAAQELRRRYRVQLILYRMAIESIWKRKVNTVGLYAFDCGLFIDFSDEKRSIE
ncbi:MAG: helicase-exonuclease AddAB subunit AddA [Sporolactobacillus sp.]